VVLDFLAEGVRQTRKVGVGVIAGLFMLVLAFGRARFST
jgi:hypothetical protein